MIRFLLIPLLSGLLAAAPPDRSVEGPTAVQWPSTSGEAGEPDDAVEPPGAPGEDDAIPSPPPPQAARPDARVVRVAVGLDPSAPGTKAERAVLTTLRDSVDGAEGIGVDARRLRIGSPAAGEVCRDGRDDLVILVGYVAQRPEPVLLPYDCSLDVALAVRGAHAADEPALVATLWKEHDALVRDGVQERRRRGRLGPRARAGIVAGVVIVVVGAAVGLLVANALRDEVVVLKVGP